MTDRTLREGRQLVRGLEDQDLQADAAAARMEDPVESLKLSVFQFFSRVIDGVDRRERLRQKVQDVIERRVDRDGDTMQLDELRGLYASTSSEVNKASEAIISLFRPVPGAPSLLANSMGSDHAGEDDPNDFYQRLSPHEREVFERLRVMMDSATKDHDSEQTR